MIWLFERDRKNMRHTSDVLSDESDELALNASEALETPAIADESMRGATLGRHGLANRRGEKKLAVAYPY